MKTTQSRFGRKNTLGRNARTQEGHTANDNTKPRKHERQLKEDRNDRTVKIKTEKCRTSSHLEQLDPENVRHARLMH